MKKISFNSPSIWQTLLNFLLGIFIFCFTLAFMFFLAEWYFTSYYHSLNSDPKTVMNLAIYQNSEHRSWEHKPFAKAEQGFGTPTPKIEINSIGLRGPELDEKKTKTRYLILGDSFAFGMGVNQDESFPARLQSFLGTKYHEVMNAGTIGQTIDDALMYLKYDGLQLKPDYVVYNFFVGNDITELRRHKWERAAETGDSEILKVWDTVLHADEQGRLRHRDTKEPSSYFLFWLNQKLSILEQKYGLIDETFDPTLTWPVFLSLDHPAQDVTLLRYWDEFEEALRQMKVLCDKNGITLIVNIIPMDVQVSDKYWKKYPGLPFDTEAFEMQRPQKQMKLLGEKYNIPVFDLLPLIQMEEKEKNIDLYFSEDPHFNAIGHRYVASYLWDYFMTFYLK